LFFRNKKRMGEVEGYDRISRMIEERQAGQPEGEDDLFEEDTVLLTRGASASGSESLAARDPVAAIDDEAVEESVTVVRTPQAIQPQPLAREAQPTVTPAAAPPITAPTPAPGFTSSVAGFESPRMTLPDTSFGGAQAGAASLVAKDAVWEGKLVCNGNVRIEGALKGEIETEGTLFVAAEARVDGTIRARNVTLAGEIQGDLHCEDRLEILPGGAARGDVNTGALVVHEGAFIDSRFQMRRDRAAG
jgi:cytoskeletal protein CcmA (bactofilin family)